VELLRKLIRFDTSNPPGAEASLIQHVEGLLREQGLETTILARDPARPNLIARLRGKGDAPPLLLYGHADVVPVVDQQWSHDPFEGVVLDGAVWGRGALDMKGGIAMMLSALLRLRRQQMVPAGDLIFALVSDEEGDGGCGAEWLVEHHAGQFANVQYAIGEFGGFSMELDGTRFYPIQVSEKQKCWLRMSVRGEGGHGALMHHNTAMGAVGRLLTALSAIRLPVHLTKPAEQMILALARSMGRKRWALYGLLQPRLANRVLRAMGEQGAAFDPLLRHTANPTVVHGGSATNVIPSRVDVQIDGRLLPGYRPADLIDELRVIVGREADIEVMRFDPGPPAIDMGLFGTLADVIREADPAGVPIPMLLSGVTDARFFARLGIQTYGFLPMRLPRDFAFPKLLHAADERIPLTALEFGCNTIFRLLERYGRGRASVAW
jgi:acetylornithine deacetylase/succinyl-diaminopimelate desuccinylase-like protein